jgi:hypothetical protein
MKVAPMSDSPYLNRRRLFKRAAAVTGGLFLVGAADLPLTGHASTARSAEQPRIYTRDEWAARAPDFAADIIDRPDHLVVHHTASPNTGDLSLERAFALSREIQDLHQLTNGWGDTGQQLTISRGGFVMEGRNRTLEALGQGLNVLGVQTANHNSHTLGIENEGIYVDENPTQELWDSLVVTLAWLCDLYALDPHESIVGHRDYVATQCPGDVFYARLPELRDAVAGSLGLGSRGSADPASAPAGPGPKAPFDHGPALGSGERTR